MTDLNKTLEVLKNLKSGIEIKPPAKGDWSLVLKVLSHAITLLTRIKDVKGIVPEEKDIPTSSSFEDVSDPTCSFERGIIAGHNLCRSIVAQNVIALSERLEGILHDAGLNAFTHPSSKSADDWNKYRKQLAQAIKKEIEGEKNE
jgi:hypothetical protein